MRPCFLLIVIVVLSSVAGSQALADGKVFAPRANVLMPDQSALIHYADGVEYLAIETRFVGEGQDFAWIVPLPSVPEIEQITPGLFPTLRVQLAPRVLD